MLFPYSSHWNDRNKETYVMSYMEVGQHGDASSKLIKELDKPYQLEVIKH